MNIKSLILKVLKKKNFNSNKLIVFKNVLQVQKIIQKI